MRAILFDLDDTLLDREASVGVFLQGQYLRYKPVHVSYEAYRDRFRELDEHGYVDKRQVYQTLIDEFAIPASVGELVADFRSKAWDDSRLFPDASKVLKQLRRQGYKLGVITNGSMESQFAKLHKSGLASFVDVALISEEEKVKKPDVAIFERAAYKLGVRTAMCVFVGDNPLVDIGGAYDAGMKTVWRKGYLSWPEGLAVVPDYTITALTELLAITF